MWSLARRLDVTVRLAACHPSTQCVVLHPPDLMDKVIGAKQGDGVRLVRGAVMTQHGTSPMPSVGNRKEGSNA
jgi:hypothetical protein